MLLKLQLYSIDDAFYASPAVHFDLLLNTHTRTHNEYTILLFYSHIMFFDTIIHSIGFYKFSLLSNLIGRCLCLCILSVWDLPQPHCNCADGTSSHRVIQSFNSILFVIHLNVCVCVCVPNSHTQHFPQYTQHFGLN